MFCVIYVLLTCDPSKATIDEFDLDQDGGINE
jgi:hypothetical protein